MRHSRPRWRSATIDLARKQPEGYLRETEEIKASKPEWRHAHKFVAAKWTHPNGHPRCKRCGQEEPISGQCSASIDLAKPANGYALPKPIYPAAPAQHVHEVQPPPEDDPTVEAVAKLLVAGLAADALFTGVFNLLRPWGVTAEAVKAAIGLANNGTNSRPNAKHSEFGSTLDNTVRKVRDHELFFRASYLCHAAKRITASMKAGSSLRQALVIESRYFQMHEKARKQRLRTISQVTTAGKLYGIPTDEGTLVGWYKNPMLNNESECSAADGHNFYAEQGTVIGLPGSVHFGCGCQAGPPIPGATSVDEAVAGVVRLKPNGPPKFKLK